MRKQQTLIVSMVCDDSKEKKMQGQKAIAMAHHLLHFDHVKSTSPGASTNSFVALHSSKRQIYLYLIIKEELLLPKFSSNFFIILIFKHNYEYCHPLS